MKGFKFTLQALLTLRQRKEREAMEDYARFLLERTRAEERLRACERALDAAQYEWQQRVASGCSASDMVHYQLHCRELAEQKNKSQAGAREAARRAEAALQKMMQARLEREVVDKFFERQKADYDRALNRAEQRFLDELANRDMELSCSQSPNPISKS